MRNLKEDRIGMVNKNTYGSLMEIVEYENNYNVWVRFEKGSPVRVQWIKFCDGQVKYVYDKSVHGVGFIGEGEYKVRENGKITPIYYTWSGMLERCYSERYHEKHPSYIGCFVDPEWHNFQNFAKWYEENYYLIEGKRMNLDKDILMKGNRYYSPDTCVFVPDNLNKLFTKRELSRGDYPIGVSFDEKWNKYKARCSDGHGKMLLIDGFDTPEEAFLAYKKFKEKLIKQIAEKYKDRIPEILYEAMINYQVDITD